jgi:fatty-acid peroxygenase
MPDDGSLDATFGLLADPYRFISRRARRLQSDAFTTRLGLRPAICLTGAAAAALFYDPERFVRRGAAPEPLRATLFGEGALQTLDGEEHLARKRMLLALLGPAEIRALVALFEAELTAATRAWARRPRIVLYRGLHPVLARAACRWAGVPLPHADVPKRTRQFVALFDAAAGPGHLRSRRARREAEQWLAGLIDEVQRGRLQADPDAALHVIATFRRPDGRRLPPRLAAVELLNVLRPTVAVSVYVAFAAHALHAHPETRARLRTGDRDYALAFVQEVRRFYPFFPAVVARVREDFGWRGLRFARGTRTLLDLYGTNHDPRTWAAPDAFRPERFLNRPVGAFDFVPQGGGDARTGHRCAGEDVTLALLAKAVDRLARGLDYEVPPQDLRIDFGRLPALPRSGVVLARVRPAGASVAEAHRRPPYAPSQAVGGPGQRTPRGRYAGAPAQSAP